VIYLDTSAFVKLVQVERETPAVRAFVVEQAGTPLISSTLLVVEARRAAMRSHPDLVHLVELTLTQVGRLNITDAVIELAGRLPDPLLRSLDAIHLATALEVRSDLDCMVTYDARLAAAAKQQRLPVVAPGL